MVKFPWIWSPVPRERGKEEEERMKEKKKKKRKKKNLTCIFFSHSTITRCLLTSSGRCTKPVCKTPNSATL